MYVCVCVFVFVRVCMCVFLCVSPGIAGICRFLYVSILSFCLAFVDFVDFVFLLRQFSKVSVTFVGAGVQFLTELLILGKGRIFTPS